MSHMSGNGESSSRYFGDSLPFINWLLDSGETCHMTPQVSNFIPGSLEDTDNKNYVTAKQNGQVQIKMCNNNGNSFIATLHKFLLVLDICDRLFSIIRCMNYGHTCLFHKVFCTVYFGNKRENVVTLPHIPQRKKGKD